MINIYVVIMCAILAAVFYILEYKHTHAAFICANVRGSTSREYIYLSRSMNRACWLARIFLFAFIILAIIEQISFFYSE